jgi:signal transduction histidine kinase
MSALSFPAVLPVDRAGLVARLRLTLVAAGYFLAGFASLLTFILLVVSLALTPILVGALALLLLVPVLAALTGRHRTVTSALTGIPIAGAYTDTRDADLPRTLLRWARDETRWRDLAFVAFDATGGAVLGVIVLSAAAAPVSLLLQPVLLGGGWWVLLWLLLPLAGLLWWILTPILFRTRLLVEARILGASSSSTAALERKVATVSAARTQALDHSAAELRRVERDLHDGAQARMVSLGMNLGLAQDLLHTDPAQVAAMLEEAQATTLSALDDLRTVVRGIHPPVLADRGLLGALHALAMDVALPVTVRGEPAGRAPAPVESAMYFAVAECLANVVKHSRARQVEIDVDHRDELLSVLVRDDGVGGASVDGGTGLAGIVRRLSPFDGRMVLDSPPGGPTTVSLELPCALSSPKTSPSSGTA